MNVKSCIQNILTSPSKLFGLVTLVSASALAAAFSAEAFFNLEPCQMCIYQRYPFAAGIVLGLIGLATRNNSKIIKTLTPLTSLNFLCNSALAFYHSGIERHWWPSPFESCSAPDFSNSPKTILENIMSAPTGRCDEIPWADPLLHLSMANYNVVLCFGIAVICAASIILNAKKA
ncbi:MAG: disulfide bond formation protein B [Alphaproteobacteria bacterium]|nr:disulfide bond formation protein B [Alphaproteobacteria bacterium]